MSDDGAGTRLVFLVSQPRAGSTLVERVLAGHPEIHAAGETWLMLPGLYALREQDRGESYDTALARRAIGAFLATLEDGPASYRSSLGRHAGDLYAQAARAAGKRLFLDKTPRYYLVLPELRATYPAARFVILVRHPLAVLHSILDTWVRPDWLAASAFARDIVDAPALLLEGIAEPGPAAHVVRYESFVADPEAETRRLCGHLGVAFHPPMLRYAESGLPVWELGDRKVYDRTAPVTTSVERWKAALAEPQFWRLARDYAALLGPRLDSLGYPAREVDALLAASRPAAWRLAGTFSLDEVLATRKGSRIGASLERFGRAWSRRGLRGAVLGGLAWIRGVEPPRD